MDMDKERSVCLLIAIVAAAVLGASLATASSAAAFAEPLPGLSASARDSHPAPAKAGWQLPEKCKDKQAKILYKAGFNKPGLLRGAWAITWRESKHQALDESSPWYTGALGVWQIQTSSWSGRPWWSRDAMLDKYTQSKIVRKHFLRNGMHNWGYDYSEKRDAWHQDAGMYYGLWGSSLTYSWVIAPFNQGWALFPKACR